MFANSVPIIQQFGFEPLRKGVSQSVDGSTSHNQKPKTNLRNMQMAFLVSPAQQGTQWIEQQLHEPISGSLPLYCSLYRADLYKKYKLLMNLAQQHAVKQA